MSHSPPSRARGEDSVLTTLSRDLQDGLRVHLPYILFGTVVVLVSIPAGLLAGDGGGDLSWLPLSTLASSVLAQENTALALFVADVDLFAALVVGALTFGILTMFGLVAQGLVTGFFVSSSLGTLDSGLLFIALVPHGVPKLLGFILGAAVSFRLVACTVGWLADRRERVFRTRDWRQAGLVLACGLCSLALAAVVEAHVTFRLANLL